MLSRRIALPFLLAVTLLGAQLPHAPGHLHAAAQEIPVSYICPMDPDVLDDKPGNCPICKMDLVSVRLESAWTCTTHQFIKQENAGKCPLDKRDLVQVTVMHYWDCGEKPEKFYTESGKCASGKPREEKREVRAHGDHNPRHGGQFFMAADKWHHLEGTYPTAGSFRVFLYDNFTKPIDVKGITGRAVTQEKDGQDIVWFDLKPSRDGKTLEAQIKNQPLPLNVAAKLKFNKETTEQRFDFTFTELSKEPPAGAPVTTTAAAAKPAPGKTAPASTPPAAAPTAAPVATAAAAPPAAPPAAPAAPEATGAAPVSVLTDCSTMSRPDATQVTDLLPSSSGELLKLISMCADEVSRLISEGQFGYVYQPTMLGKDIALALEGHAAQVPEQRKLQLAIAVRRMVLAAWQLDLYGDLGNKEKLTDAYNRFAAAVAEIKTAYDAR